MSSDNVYVLDTAHARLLLQGPPGIGIGSCLSLAGHLFWDTFCDALFSLKVAIWDEKCTQNGTQHEVFWDLLFRESVNMEK